MASLLVFVVSRLDRNQKRGSKNTDLNNVCRYEVSFESEMSTILGEKTSREVLIVTDKETVL